MIWAAAICFAVVCCVVGFVTIIKSLVSSNSSQPSLPNPPTEPTGPRSFGFNTDPLRVKIEDLYFQKKLTKEGLSELMSFFRLKVPIEPIQSKPEAKIGDPAPLVTSPTKSTDSTSSSLKQPTSMQSKPSGFFSSDNIKTLLITGSALFVLSAYLFVRSFWAVIPDLLKFGALLVISIGIYLIGARFRDKKILPSTTETLLVLSQVLIPFNLYALNILVLDSALSSYTAWCIGFILMFFSSYRLMNSFPCLSLGITTGVAFQGIFAFGGLAQSIASQLWYLLLAGSTLTLCLFTFLLDQKEKPMQGLLSTINMSSSLLILGICIRGFFLSHPNHLPTVFTLIVLGIVFAVQSRLTDYRFAYFAGPCFMGAGAVLLHHFKVPTYKYGLFFVPAGLLATLRSWRFEKTNRENLARPYFILGQVSIVASLVAIFPYFSFYMGTGFYTLSSIMILTTLVYGILTVLYKNPVFTYAGGLALLFLGWINIWHFKLPFSDGIALFGWMGMAFSLIGLSMRKSIEKLVNTPLQVLGLGALSLSLAFAIGQWGHMRIIDDTFILNMSADQISAGIKVGLMCAIAYGISAYIKKRGALFYPALVSTTLVYIFVLEKMDLPIHLLNLSWIVLISMALFYLTNALNWSTISRSFAVWSQLIFGVIFIGALSSNTMNYPAVFVCALAFAPALLLGYVDLNTSFYLAIYSGHFLWFNHTIGSLYRTSHSIVYSTHLLVLNMIVVLVRGLVKIPRPTISLNPYKIFIVVFSVISMAFALQSKEHAWQIFFAYGVLTILISLFFYDKKWNGLGATLLLFSYELFLISMDVELTEAYSVPAGLFILVCGFLLKRNKKDRTPLYIFGQLVLYIPSFLEAHNETWGAHGIFLGVMAIIIMLLGIHLRNRALTFLSLGFLVGNALVQSMVFLKTIPRWIYLGLGGTTLVTLGGLFEFQREKLVKMRRTLVTTLEGWD